MENVIIYHNPRCSKSRQTLKLLQDKGIKPTVIEYLNNPPTVSELDTILTQLNKQPEEITRKKEEVYKTLGLKGQNLGRQEYIKMLVENPVLIERPIVVNGKKAALGRPPENVLEIL